MIRGIYAMVPTPSNATRSTEMLRRKPCTEAIAEYLVMWIKL